MTIQRGKFISIEGIDGAGKSTHVPLILELMRALTDTQVIATREPGGTPFGEKLREILLKDTVHLETETLTMFAARRENIATVIEPALSRGDWVFSDRFTDSSFAYQGGGRGLSWEKLKRLEEWTCDGLKPDLTFLFDLPLEVARARINTTRELDKFEKEQDAFFCSARNAYLNRVFLDPGRFCCIDASQSIAGCEAQIRSYMLEWAETL